MSILSILSLLFILFFNLADTAPISSEYEEPQRWRESPAARGSINILFSCVAALIVCVWTGVHLNIKPIENTRKELEQLSTFLEKLVWASIALLAPDIILVVALHQLLVAMEYRSYVNKKAGTRNSGKKLLGILPKAHPEKMSLKMAFFATMGGFSVEIHNVNGTRTFALKFPDLDQLAMIDRIHDFPVSEIKDKSKVSTFAKTIVCVQTGWVLLQCLGRQIDHLHITLLEVNTAVHVVIAIIVYCIWWEKPVDISRPILVLRRGSQESSHEMHKAAVGQALDGTARVIERALIPSPEEDRPNNHSEFSPNTQSPRSNTPTNGSTRRESSPTPNQIARSRATHFLSMVRTPSIDPAHPNIRQTLSIAALFCRTIDTAPRRARKMMELVPNAIQSYLLSATKKDVRKSILQMHKRASDDRVHVESTIAKAAHTAAFREAYREAFKAAHGEIHGVVNGITRSGMLYEEDEKIGEQLISLNSALDKAFRAIRERTYKASYRAAASAAKNAYDRDGVTHTTPADQNLGILMANIRAANAATRAASRHAMLLAALDESLGKGVSAEAAAKAFEGELQAVAEDEGIEDVATRGYIRTQARDGADIIRKSVLEDFRERYHGSTSRSGLGTEVDVTAGFVEWASYSGISEAVEKLVRKAQADAVKSEASADDIQLRPACNAAQNQLQALEETPHYKTNTKLSKTDKLRRTLQMGAATITAQMFAVPGLFQPTHYHLETPTDDPNTKLPDGPVFFGHTWRKTHRIVLIVFSGCAGAFYGAIHSTKWNSRWFPTEIERQLWRISCIVGAASFIPITLLAVLAFWMPLGYKKLSVGGWIGQIVLFALLLGSSGLFMAARVFLVLESFLSLRHLPSEAFQTVLWSEAIPHL